MKTRNLGKLPPAYNSNLSLLTAKVKFDKEFQQLTKKARSLAGIPKNGIKKGDKSFWIRIEDEHTTYFLPQIWLEQSGNLNEFYNTVKAMCSDFPKDYMGNSHFEQCVRDYIFFNRISAPAYNAWVHVSYDKDGRRSFPSPLYYGYQYVEDKKLVNDLMKSLTERYDNVYKRPLRGMKSLSDYEKIAKWDKGQKRERITEEKFEQDGKKTIKVMLGTYKSLAEVKYGIKSEENSNLVDNEHDRIRQIKSRCIRYLANRGIVASK